METLEPIHVVLLGAVLVALAGAGLYKDWYGALLVSIITLAAGLIWFVVEGA